VGHSCLCLMKPHTLNQKPKRQPLLCLPACLSVYSTCMVMERSLGKSGSLMTTSALWHRCAFKPVAPPCTVSCSEGGGGDPKCLYCACCRYHFVFFTCRQHHWQHIYQRSLEIRSTSVPADRIVSSIYTEQAEVFCAIVVTTSASPRGGTIASTNPQQEEVVTCLSCTKVDLLLHVQ
jgi:hypothetical protein